MPSAERILSGLSQVSNDAAPLAMAWHAILFLAITALLLGWRPSRRTAACLSTIPLASVSALAFAFGNAFNGVVFAGLFAALSILGARLGTQRVELSGSYVAALGGMLIAFAWTYPHFLRTSSALVHFVAAPLGLVPCPSLALVIGFALLARGFGARAWPAIVAAAGAFYGLFGAAVLGVHIDLVLLLGAVALGAVALVPRESRLSERAF